MARNQDNETPQVEETFTDKLGISLVSTSMFESLLEDFAGVDVVIAAMGKSGIGKTAIPRQVAARRKAPYICMDGPTTNIEDFSVPTTAVDTNQYYDKRIPRKFKEIIDYVARVRKENKGQFPVGKNPILAIEELNRTVDKHVTRAFFTLLNERMIGDIHLDEAIQFVVTLNPSGGGMAVNEFERDPAMRRRMQFVGVAANYGDFMKYARKQQFHHKILEHLEAQPNHFYDDVAATSGKMFPCPATWEAVSKMCYRFEEREVELFSAKARAFFAGAIGTSAAEQFVEFIQDASVVITPEEVLQHYMLESSVRTRFLELVKNTRLDKISQLSVSVALKLYENTKRRPETYGRQLALFMEDMQEDVTLSFIRELAEQSKAVSGGQAYLIALNAMMTREPYFHSAIERLQKAQQKGKEEAEKDGF